VLLPWTALQPPGEEQDMGAVVGIVLIVGALIGSFAIPPHHLFRTQRARPESQASPSHGSPNESRTHIEGNQP
jgi:hypothetical protein